jgi:hypothetical protein
MWQKTVFCKISIKYPEFDGTIDVLTTMVDRKTDLKAFRQN